MRQLRDGRSRREGILGGRNPFSTAFQTKAAPSFEGAASARATSRLTPEVADFKPTEAYQSMVIVLRQT
jgi:hypothetical protein